MFKIKRFLDSTFNRSEAPAAAVSASGSGKPGNREFDQDEFDKDKIKLLLKEHIFRAYQDNRGVHIESVLSALGALSGFALQLGIRESLIKKQGTPEHQIFMTVETKSGETFYFGSIFDEPLYDTREGRTSVWALIAGGAQRAGAKDLPDITAMARANASSMGEANYGRHSVAAEHQPREHPVLALQKHWTFARNLLRAMGGDPLFWSWHVASVIQDVIVQGKDVLSPSVAAHVAMESAISMSKIDPAKIVKSN